MKEKIQRCFISLDLSREAINEIKKIQELIKKNNLFTGKFTELENLHLTLKFLGEIDGKKVEEVKERLKDVKIDGFDVELGETGVFSKKFPKNQRFLVSKKSIRKEFSDIRIIWIKLKGAEKLQKEIDEKLEGLFGKEERFMSHITIARVKYVKNRKKLIEYLKNIKSFKTRFRIDKFFLKKSELFAEGPVYSEIEEYNLK